jgi:hypothetical protein
VILGRKNLGGGAGICSHFKLNSLRDHFHLFFSALIRQVFTTSGGFSQTPSHNFMFLLRQISELYIIAYQIIVTMIMVANVVFILIILYILLANPCYYYFKYQSFKQFKMMTTLKEDLAHKEKSITQ